MTLCTSSVVVVTACTEATYQYHIKTTGIPSQLYPRPKQKPRGSMARLVSERCSSSIWLAYPNRSHLRRNILLASCTCMVNCRQEKPRKHSKYTQQMQRYETVTFRQKVTNYPVPVLVKLLFSSIDAVPRYCRPIDNFAKRLEATRGVVVSRFIPTSA